MHRIAVLGIGGSGKSVAGRELATRTGLPLFHMDPLFWKGKWELIPEQETLREHEKLVSQDAWIIEGYIEESMKSRVERADLIVYLDYSGLLACWRAVGRYFKHRKKSRSELPDEALERFSPRFFWVVLTKGERGGIEKALTYADQSKVRRFKSPRDFRCFVEVEMTNNKI